MDLSLRTENFSVFFTFLKVLSLKFVSVIKPI